VNLVFGPHHTGNEQAIRLLTRTKPGGRRSMIVIRKACRSGGEHFFCVCFINWEGYVLGLDFSTEELE
jgi:hypothetical protein